MCEARCTVVKNIQKIFLQPGDFDLILSKLEKYIVNVVFQGDCEPTMNPYLPELVKVAAKYTKQIGLVSNGTLLSEELSRQLIENGLNWFAISLDDHRKEKYNQIRIGAELEKVVANIDTLVKLRDTQYPDISIVTHKIVFAEDTLADLKDYVYTFYLKHRVNKVTFAPMVDTGEIMVKNWLMLRNELENEIMRDGYQINLHDFANYPYRSMHKYCGTNLFFISHEGNLAPCGLHTRLGKKFGNLITDDLETIASSEQFINFHQYWLERKFNEELPQFCKGCFLLESPYFYYCLDEGIDAVNNFEEKFCVKR